MSDKKTVTCPECSGSGYKTKYLGLFGIMPSRHMCWKCCGRGKVEQ